MKVLIKRLKDDRVQTTGVLEVYDRDNLIFKCYTLELPDKENKKRVSRIPEGKYNVVKRYSSKFKNHFYLKEVPGRSWILIHAGNTYRHTKGCILVGLRKKDIDLDGNMDITSSKSAMEKLNSILDKEFTLKIFNEI